MYPVSYETHIEAVVLIFFFSFHMKELNQPFIVLMDFCEENLNHLELKGLKDSYRQPTVAKYKVLNLYSFFSQSECFQEVARLS